MDIFVKLKLYLDRSKMYLGYLSFLMILFLFADQLKQYEIFAQFFPKSTLAIPAVAVVCFFLLLFFGWLDERLGIWQSEMHYSSMKNPAFSRILEKLDAIEEELKRKK